MVRTDVEQRQEYVDFMNHVLETDQYKLDGVRVLAIIDEQLPLAVVGYSRMTQFHCEVSIASVSPRFCTRPVLHHMFWIPFVQWGYLRIHSVVSLKRPKALDFNRRLGFTQEGQLSHWFGDADGIMFRMLRHECRWLDEDERKAA